MVAPPPAQQQQAPTPKVRPSIAAAKKSLASQDNAKLCSFLASFAWGALRRCNMPETMTLKEFTKCNPQKEKTDICTFDIEVCFSLDALILISTTVVGAKASAVNARD